MAGVIWILGAIEISALGAFGWLESLALPLPRLLLPAGALACYGAALWSAGRMRVSGSSIWMIAVLGRLALLPLTPELSDDLYRYLWDGHVFASGLNPYAHAPDDAELAALRTPWHDRINHPDIRTIYPPLAQVLFLFVAVVGGGAVTAKVLWLVFDLGTGLLLARIAVLTNRNGSRVLIAYLWSPLFIVETAWSAHFDAAGLFVITALLWTSARPSRRRREVWVGGLLGLAALVKFAPAAMLPVAVRRYGMRVLPAFLGLGALFYLPFVRPGVQPLFEGLVTYARHWSANEGAFALISALVGHPVHARVVASAAVLTVVAWATWRKWSMERALLWILGAGLLLSPTLHPWYVLWVLPAAALRTNAPFLCLSGLVFLGYWGVATYGTEPPDSGRNPSGPGWPSGVLFGCCWLPNSGAVRG